MSRDESATEPFTLVFYVLLLAWVVALTYWATGWDSWRDQLFPLLVTIPTALLVVVQLVRLRRPDSVGRRSRGGDDDGDDSASSREAPERGDDETTVDTERLVVVFGWVAAFPVAIYYVGFLLSIPAFLFGFVGYLLDDWRRAAVISLVTTGVVALSVAALGVQLWEGVLAPLA